MILKRKKPGDHNNSFSFENRTDEYRNVAVVSNKRKKIIMHIEVDYTLVKVLVVRHESVDFY